MPTAIILSMGMLLESVNNQAFIGRMLIKAKAHNPAFTFSKPLLINCLSKADEFNRNEITAEKFMADILTLLGDIKMEKDEFWGHWNEIIKVGDIKQTLEKLKEFCATHQSTIYLTSDTNEAHLKKLRTELAAAGINFNTGNKPGSFDQFPLYTSCGYGKNRFELTQEVIAAIKNQATNKPDVTIVVLGDPANIKDEALRNASQAETITIKQWCDINKVKLVLHNNEKRLIATLESALEVKNENTATNRMTMNG